MKMYLFYFVILRIAKAITGSVHLYTSVRLCACACVFVYVFDESNVK